MNCCLSEALQAALDAAQCGARRIIHQTWKTTEVPEAWATSLQQWTALHPEWIHILWTDTDIEYYMKTKWPDDVQLFQSLPWTIQRIDLWRYYVLRDFGGIYCDLDIEPTKNVTSFITDGPIQLVASANTPSVFTNALMVSDTSKVAKAFWTSLIETVRSYSASRTLSVVSAASRHLEIMESTGPLALTRAVRNSEWPITILPSKLWNPYDLSVADMPSMQTNEKALIKLLPGSSWHEVDSTALSLLLVYKGPIIAFVILILVFYIVKSEIVRSKFASLRRFLRRSKP